MLQPTYLTPDQVAERLDVHSDTVRRWILSGRLRGFRVGIRYRVEPQEVERFIADGQITAQPTAATTAA